MDPLIDQPMLVFTNSLIPPRLLDEMTGAKKEKKKFSVKCGLALEMEMRCRCG